MRLDPEILDGPPEVGARIVALARLADAEEALGRVADPADAEALHDFRVALRRLRSTLRGLAPFLGDAGREAVRERLADVQDRTGPARDAEVLARWLEAARAELAAPYRGALDWLLDRAERRRRRAAEEAAREALPRFQRRAARLERDLTARPARAPGAATFGDALVTVLRPHTRALRDAVLAVAGSGDAAGLHRARIETKRLRYLLEPLQGAGAGAEAAVELLEVLQDDLGEWHDAHAAAEGLEGALLEARAEEARRDGAALPGLRPGLLALLQLATRRRDAAWARVAAHLAARATPVTDAAYAVVAALEGAAAAGEAPDAQEPPPAPERRFLVTALPPEARSGEAEQLDQGWLPGDGRESVGVTRSTVGERWFRARAPGRGRRGRVELLSRADFDAYWPLTEGRRISKRRHLVAGTRGWHLDEYLDRPLCLAVAEEGHEGELPGWLEAILVREVSSERAYLDEALARRPAKRTG